MNNLGIVCALSVLLNVWLGHILVRTIEARAVSIRLPASAFAVMGMVLIRGSLLSSSSINAAVLGITGVICVWDGLEFLRQEQRVKQGHAPANPHNERHRQILAEYPQANSVKWLKREPIGREFTADEIRALKEQGQ